MEILPKIDWLGLRFQSDGKYDTTLIIPMTSNRSSDSVFELLAHCTEVVWHLCNLVEQSHDLGGDKAATTKYYTHNSLAFQIMIVGFSLRQADSLNTVPLEN